MPKLPRLQHDRRHGAGIKENKKGKPGYSTGLFSRPWYMSIACHYGWKRRNGTEVVKTHLLICNGAHMSLSVCDDSYCTNGSQNLTIELV